MKNIRKAVFYIIAAVVSLATACNDVDNVVPVTGVTVDIMSLSMVIGDHETLTATIEPENASNQEVIWTSSDKEVATVDETGKVTALAQGETKISVTSMDGGFRTSCVVAVYAEPVPVTGVTLDAEAVSVAMGQRHNLKVTVLPENATDKFVVWRSDATTIAQVNASGLVNALDVGQATITVRTRDGNFAATCVVNVTPVMTLDKKTLSLSTGALGGTKLTATLPAVVQNQVLEWASSDPAVAAVSGALSTTSASVTALSPGTTTITVTSRDEAYAGGVYTTTCEVTVVAGAALETVTLNLGDNLKTAVTANPGKIIILPSGFTAAFDGVAIPAGGIWIKGDPNASVKPKLTNAGINFNERLAGEIIRFENVELVGTGFDQGGYFINQGTGIPGNSCNLKELSFENCIISEFGRSVVRMQTADQRIGLLKFNNCIIARCSSQPGQDYAVVQCTAAGLAFPDIRITNTTINNVYAELLRISGGAGQPSGKDVLIENVTFYKVSGSNATPPGTRYFIDAGNNGPVNITVKNSILGSVRGLGVENGIRMNAAGTLTGEGNYATTDWTLVTDPTADPPVMDIPATPYSSNCNALFTDPANGDFHIKDSGFAGKSTAGDPRWR